MKKPKSLKEGDTVLICAPASPPISKSAFDDAIKLVEKLGYNPKLGKNAKRREGFLAGTDSERAADLIQGLQDPKVKAIMCIRGGYGSARTLPMLLRAKFPSKILLGFSDITALQAAMYNRGFKGSIHAPLFSLSKSRNIKIFKKLVSGESNLNLLDFLSKAETKKIITLRKGVARGKLIAANLTVLCSLIGTQYFPNLNDTILLLEDVNEPPYRVDRALTQLLMSGSLKKVKAIGFGEFTLEKKQNSKYQSFKDVFIERLSELKIPIMMGLPFGHNGLQLPLPVGVKAEIDTFDTSLVITESLTV